MKNHCYQKESDLVFVKPISAERFPKEVILNQAWVSAKELSKKYFTDIYMMNGHINSLLSQSIITVEYRNNVLGYKGLPPEKHNMHKGELPNHPLYC